MAGGATPAGAAEEEEGRGIRDQDLESWSTTGLAPPDESVGTRVCDLFSARWFCRSTTRARSDRHTFPGHPRFKNLIFQKAGFNFRQMF